MITREEMEKAVENFSLEVAIDRIKYAPVEIALAVKLTQDKETCKMYGQMFYGVELAARRAREIMEDDE